MQLVHWHLPPTHLTVHSCDPLQRLVEQFESLMLSAGPGAPEADVGTFPRPVGEEQAAAHAAQQPYDPGNCSAANMRPTVMGVPNSTALRLRCVIRTGCRTDAGYGVLEQSPGSSYTLTWFFDA
jgi:hypothetical protein